MITYVNGDLFTSPAQVLVNTVNTVGVMGKGIAHEFKRIYPDMFKVYRQYCENRQLTVGKLHLHRSPHKWVLNFPTKAHWRHASSPHYIESGLSAFRDTYSAMGVTSVAFPALGCGNGGLSYNDQVRPLMEAYLGSLPIPVFVYLPTPRTAPPEHRDAERVARWLRATPAALPFDEMWQDLSDIVAASSEFATIPRGRVFRAEVAHELDKPPGLRIAASGRSYSYRVELLLEFWQQLRDYGFVHRGIAPSHHRVSYLIPVFARLPYVETVTVSNSAHRLHSQPAVALQVVPPIAPDHGLFTPNSYAMAEA